MDRVGGGAVCGKATCEGRVVSGRQRITIEMPPPRNDGINLRCEMCGREFTEGDWYHEPRMVPLCPGCAWPPWYPRGEGIRFNWWAEYDASPLAMGRLLYRQSVQIAAALVALEDEWKKPH
jgi:hypothetical protein